MNTLRSPLAANVHRAFTLIELLVVVAIISILASIAVPNFLEAQTRAKVARMKNDMRIMTIGIETYALDNNSHFPYRRATNIVMNPNYDPNDLNPYSVHYGEFLQTYSLPEKHGMWAPLDPNIQATQIAKLTTPIGYISHLYIDVFDRHDLPPDNLIDYWDDVQTAWFINNCPTLVTPDPITMKYRISRPRDIGYTIVSLGPDCDIGAPRDNYQGWHTVYDLQYTMYQSYDPSNGTISAGNIYLIPQLGGFDGTPPKLTTKFYPPELYSY